MQKCRKPLWTEYPSNATHAINATGARVPIQTELYSEVLEIEFEDTDEWHSDYYGTFKSQFRLLSQTITEQFSVLGAETLSQYFDSLIQREQATSGNLPAQCLEFKTLALEFDMLHYVYSPLLLVLLPPDSKGKKTIAEGGKEVLNPITREDLLAVQNITVRTLNHILAWKPQHPVMQMEQYKILQYHFPLLKLSTEHLGAAFTVMFTALSTTVAAAGSSQSTTLVGANVPANADKDANVEQSTKISGCISSLTQHCALEIVQTGFFNEFFQQVKFITISLLFVVMFAFYFCVPRKLFKI